MWSVSGNHVSENHDYFGVPLQSDKQLRGGVMHECIRFFTPIYPSPHSTPNLQSVTWSDQLRSDRFSWFWALAGCIIFLAEENLQQLQRWKMKGEVEVGDFGGRYQSDWFATDNQSSSHPLNNPLTLFILVTSSCMGSRQRHDQRQLRPNQ